MKYVYRTCIFLVLHRKELNKTIQLNESKKSKQIQPSKNNEAFDVTTHTIGPHEGGTRAACTVPRTQGLTDYIKPWSKAHFVIIHGEIGTQRPTEE